MEQIIKALSGVRFLFGSEKELQEQVFNVLQESGIECAREVRLDSKNIIDIMVGTIGIEIKVSTKQQRTAIYKQCQRYTSFSEVTELIVVTSKALVMPTVINDKKCTIFNLSKAWM